MMNVKDATFEQYVEEDHEVQDFTKDGECSRCGGCCSRMLPMSHKEEETIRKYIKRNRVKPHELEKNLVLAEKPYDFTCPFLELGEETQCKIYAVRPGVCKAFLCNKDDGQVATDLSIEDLNKYKELPARRVIDMWDTFFKK